MERRHLLLKGAVEGPTGRVVASTDQILAVPGYLIIASGAKTSGKAEDLISTLALTAFSVCRRSVVLGIVMSLCVKGLGKPLRI
ncbi:MAG: hypothetical protein ACR2QH_06275, partial [Geminicoccaceae bacterium]